MAGPSENTPLLSSDDRLASHDESQSPHLKFLPEKSQFNLAITILRVLISFLSLSIFGILLATHVLITTGPFDFVSNSEQAVRILAIIVLVNFILCTLIAFLQTPGIFNVPLNVTMSIVLLVFSNQLLGDGWPDAKEGYNKIFCMGRWRGPDDIFIDPKCEHARDVIKILMSVSAGVSIVISLLLLAVLLLELTALSRGGTRFMAQIGVGSVPAERSTGPANALLNGEEG